MSRLPSALQPAWPLFKRLHRLTTLLSGLLARRTSRLIRGRALPQRSAPTSVDTAAAEPGDVAIHWGLEAEEIDRQQPQGDPVDHWRFADARRFTVGRQYALELTDGAVAGDWGATITAAGTLDLETSEYFGIESWREHPVFLAAALPPPEVVDGTVVSLTTRGGNRNYYHYLLDVLPRWGVFRECLPDREPDAIYVPRETAYQEQLLTLLGLDSYRIIPVTPSRTVRASSMVVPCLQNPKEMAPSWTIDWLRNHLKPVGTTDKPRRIYVTRRGGKNTRRLIQEDQVWPMLERQGFARIDPGTMTVRDQIDHFAAAEVIVGLHGAALSNLVFAQPGVRVLEMFPHNYVKPCFWAITESVPDAKYHYLVAGGPESHGRDQSMLGIQADIDLDAGRVADSVTRLLEA